MLNDQPPPDKYSSFDNLFTTMHNQNLLHFKSTGATVAPIIYTAEYLICHLESLLPKMRIISGLLKSNTDISTCSLIPVLFH